MAKVTFAEHHDVVETLASDRSDQPFNVTVLPRRSRRDRSVSNAHGPQSTGDRSAIRRVTVSDEIARSFVPRKCLSDLLGNPLGGWICGDIGPNQRPTTNSPSKTATWFPCPAKDGPWVLS